MSGADPLTRRYLSIRGLVQGVGFRWFAKETADELGLTGWVRNRDDGAVELEAEGTAAALDEFVRRLKKGNTSARVDEVAEVPHAPKGGRGFEIRR
jgi:acylphosphatase